MSCQQVPTTPAFNPYPRSVQVGEFEVAIGGGIWVAIRALAGQSVRLDKAPMALTTELVTQSASQMAGSRAEARFIAVLDQLLPPWKIV